MTGARVAVLRARAANQVRTGLHPPHVGGVPGYRLHVG
jgi:hypothetical protein